MVEIKGKRTRLRGSQRQDLWWLAVHRIGISDQTWWRHPMETFSELLAICTGNSPVPVNSLHKGQWRGALIFSLICVWINGWVNNREAGDWRRYRAHYNVMEIAGHQWFPSQKASDAELWCFLWTVPERVVEETIETPVIWDAIMVIITSL